MSETWLDRNRTAIFAALVLVTVAGATLFYLRQPSREPIELLPAEPTATQLPSPTPEPTFTPAPIRIYITGAVSNSDVYLLPFGSIIKDAVEAAGGFTPAADPERINQALELRDQQQIHIPRRGEEDPLPPIQGGRSDSEEVRGNEGSSASGAQVNLNTATLEQLDALPGIGPAIGQRVIDYRETVGGFTSVEEITQVSGIGDSTFAKIKDLITVEAD